MKESYTNSLKIDDGSVMTAPAFQAFMHFIYGGAGAMEELSPENAMYLVEVRVFIFINFDAFVTRFSRFNSF